MEYGSDFHMIDYPRGRSLLDIYPESRLYASGRQSLLALIRHNKWRRIWLPVYCCYEFLGILDQAPISREYYDCLPTDNPVNATKSLPFQDGDVLLRINFFGLHSNVNDTSGHVPVIEDHTHSPLGTWALSSTADFCIASLRKTLPIADGGILWSPKGLPLPPQPPLDMSVDQSASIRYEAMLMKKAYLAGENVNKEDFRNMYIQTENQFCSLPLSSPSKETTTILNSLNAGEWLSRKEDNYHQLITRLQPGRYKCVMPSKNASPFSLILLCDDKELRDKLRRYLISNSVYPAMLWEIPESAKCHIRGFADRMLSIHCDGRYSSNDMEHIASLINQFFANA